MSKNCNPSTSDVPAVDAIGKKLKFLFVSADKFPPFRVDVAVLLGEEIAGRGHAIDWILQSEAACDVSYETGWEGGHVWVGRTHNGTSRLARLRKHLYSIRHDLKLFHLMRSKQYDFVQVKDKFIAALFALLAARKNNVRFLYWLSFPFPEESLYKVRDGIARYPLFYWIRGHVFKFLLYKVIMRGADYVFVQSEQMKRDVAAQGIPEDKLIPVPMGVKLDDIPYPETGSEVAEQKRMLVYLGTLERARRIDFLVRVLAKVLEKAPEARLCLVGDGHSEADRNHILDHASRLGVGDAISITGFIPREEALQYVASASVCLSPFFPTPILNSTSPTKLVEYMAMGKPVVANDHPEQKRVIAESGGGFCVPYDEAPFAEAIVTLLHAPERAHEMGRHGRRYVESHRSYNKIADIVEREYLRICYENAA